ncbi:hypothetical protein TRFO_17697 [Tritrichomonas foetus]|uniref:Uncharacterized protein n=1 Tax=Tritrichomonas foetus TaxID=1144522 RepID=A0A1J4KNE8_9EUKA|nr:hypothetical protein TRFO_17697 [Tritrichomonas foetus]|eukprot:OHT12432.1 hypothetical protein TRFO_17697 [Tritrichomonas foetus]
MYELEIIYNIYSLFINHLPVEELSQWITNDMILNMIKCIGTPDVSEQALLVKAFGEIIDKLPYTKPLIYHKLLYIISNYNNGEFLHYHIIVSLKILRLLFRSKEYKWDCEHIMELYKVLYPLYKSEFLSCFYIELNALLRFLFSLDASLSSDLSSYLLQHFPITNSSKQFPFLHQIMSLIIFNSKCIKYNDMKLLSSILFKCISSDNQNVAINSIFFICNENKIVALSSISHSIVASIVNGLIEQSNSWSQTISSSAIDSLNKVKNIAFRHNICLTSPISSQSINWSEIKRIALSNSKNFIGTQSP